MTYKETLNTLVKNYSDSLHKTLNNPKAIEAIELEKVVGLPFSFPAVDYPSYAPINQEELMKYNEKYYGTEVRDSVAKEAKLIAPMYGTPTAVGPPPGVYPYGPDNPWGLKPIPVDGPMVTLCEEHAKQVTEMQAKLDVKAGVATRADAGKLNWSLMPFDALEEILKVLEFGALKYDGWNFAKGEGMKWTRVSNSLVRHLFAWMRGEDNDPESGCSHLGHLGCNVIFLLYYIRYGEVYGAGDDRFKR